MNKGLLILAGAMLITGCATSTSNYAPPKIESIQNSIVVDKPFDAVWDSLVKELSSDFFVINNIDKNSRLINISFSSNRPSDFVDCGVTSRSFKNLRGDHRYVYKTADSSEFAVTNDAGIAMNVRRASKLEGRSNIYVAPEGNGTNVTVNTKYVVSVNMSGVTFDGRHVGSESFIFDPSTKQPFVGGSVTCAATGNIERRIINAVN